MAAITIIVNGEERDLDSELDLNDLLRHLAVPEKSVAVELNGKVVSRIDWPQTIVSEGDTIEVVHFVGGG